MEDDFIEKYHTIREQYDYDDPRKNYYETYKDYNEKLMKEYYYKMLSDHNYPNAEKVATHCKRLYLFLNLKAETVFVLKLVVQNMSVFLKMMKEMKK